MRTVAGIARRRTLACTFAEGKHSVALMRLGERARLVFTHARNSHDRSNTQC